MPEAEQMEFATAGPGTIRRPIDAAVGGDDDASDELGEEIDPATEASSKGAAGSNDENYEEETVVGIDQAGNPSVVEHFAAFKLQLDLLQKHVQSSAAQPEASSDMTAMTARAARQAESARIVYDLQAAGRKLLKHDFQKEIGNLEKMEQGLLVPSGRAMSTFEASTWTECFTEFWYGDALPNQKERPRYIPDEDIFKALQDREELEYTLESDERPFRARGKSRFDTAEMTIVFGDTLRRLAMFSGTTAGLKRRGCQGNA